MCEPYRCLTGTKHVCWPNTAHLVQHDHTVHHKHDVSWPHTARISCIVDGMMHSQHHQCKPQSRLRCPCSSTPMNKRFRWEASDRHFSRHPHSTPTRIARPKRGNSLHSTSSHTLRKTSSILVWCCRQQNRQTGPAPQQTHSNALLPADYTPAITMPNRHQTCMCTCVWWQNTVRLADCARYSGMRTILSMQAG